MDCLVIYRVGDHSREGLCDPEGVPHTVRAKAAAQHCGQRQDEHHIAAQRDHQRRHALAKALQCAGRGGGHCRHERPACRTVFRCRPERWPHTGLFCSYCAFPSGLQDTHYKASRSCTVLRMSNLTLRWFAAAVAGCIPAGMARLSGMYLSLACIGK